MQHSRHREVTQQTNTLGSREAAWQQCKQRLHRRCLQKGEQPRKAQVCRIQDFGFPEEKREISLEQVQDFMSPRDLDFIPQAKRSD